jgi:hypothetical protein
MLSLVKARALLLLLLLLFLFLLQPTNAKKCIPQQYLFI